MSTKYKVGDCVRFKPVYAEFFRLAHSIPHGTHGMITNAESLPTTPLFSMSHYQILFSTGNKVLVAGDDLLEKIPTTQ
jgi:hypothetical protein